MATSKLIDTYHFPEAKSIVVSGDIHGDFNLLVNKVCVQYQMRDTLVIVAGDCGFGFERKGYYEGIVRRNAKRMSEANNWIVFVRGNHDNPAYFNGSSFNHKRFVAIPDYSVVKACGHTILCIGGAISIDRRYRIDSWNQKQKKVQRFDTAMTEADPLAPNYYWPDENPVFDQEKLIKISAKEAIDTVVTHTAPSFCELQSKAGLVQWSLNDALLLDDVENERMVMDQVFDKLRELNQPVAHWYYGHFHQSWHSSIDGVLFKMLDIIELTELRS